MKVQYEANAELVQAVAFYCPNVRQLEAYHLNDEIIGLLNHQRIIERLEFSLTAFEPERTATLLELPHLRKLTINWHQETGNEEILCSVVRQCPELTHFSLELGHMLVEFPGLRLFENLAKLIALNFSSPSIDDATLSDIADLCPLIEHLDLRDNSRITDDGLFTVATKLKLKSIAFCCSKTITGCGLLHLRHCSSTLKVLCITQTVGFPHLGTHPITVNAIQTLQQSCTQLTMYDWRSVVWYGSFDFTECTCATTIVFSVAATDALLLSMTQHCTQLKHLNIIRGGYELIPRYTSVGLYAVIHNCPLLQTIRVNENMDQKEFGEILGLYKHIFVCSTDYGESLYDVMDM